MEKHKLLFLLTLISISSFSCTSNNMEKSQGFKYEVDYYNYMVKNKLKGPVKSITEHFFEIIDAEGTLKKENNVKAYVGNIRLKPYDKLTFNNDGNIIKSFAFNKMDSLILKAEIGWDNYQNPLYLNQFSTDKNTIYRSTKFIYDYDRNEMKATVLNNGDFHTETKTKFNTNGKKETILTSSIVQVYTDTTENYITNFHYNRDSNLIKEETIGETTKAEFGKAIYTHNVQGKVIDEKFYHKGILKSQNIHFYNSKNEKVDDVEYKNFHLSEMYYDDEQKINKKVTSVFSEGTLYRKLVTHFDSLENFKSSKEYFYAKNSDRENLISIEVKYTYDKYGNWVTAFHDYSEDNPNPFVRRPAHTKLVRDIEYFK